MPVYEVSYDMSGGPAASYSALRNFLKKSDSWRDQYSVWFVCYEGSDAELYSELSPLVSLRDRLKVVAIQELTVKYNSGSFVWLRDHGLRPKSST